MLTRELGQQLGQVDVLHIAQAFLLVDLLEGKHVRRHVQPVFHAANAGGLGQDGLFGLGQRGQGFLAAFLVVAFQIADE